MKAIVSYGGGITSVEALDRTLKKYGRENTVAIFAKIEAVRDERGRVVEGEDDDLYRLMDEAQDYLDFKITILTSGQFAPGIWSVFFDQRMIGNSRVDPCSRHLKRKVLRNWIKANADPATDILVTGLDGTEPNRIADFRAAVAPFKCDFPLTDYPQRSKAQLFIKWAQLGIDPPDLNEEGFFHNNCAGFCVKAGHPHFYNLWKKRPWVYAHHEKKEKEFQTKISYHTVVKNHSLEQLRLRFEGGYIPKERGRGGCRGTCVVPQPREFD